MSIFLEANPTALQKVQRVTKTPHQLRAAVLPARAAPKRTRTKNTTDSISARNVIHLKGRLNDDKPRYFALREQQGPSTTAPDVATRCVGHGYGTTLPPPTLASMGNGPDQKEAVAVSCLREGRKESHRIKSDICRLYHPLFFSVAFIALSPHPHIHSHIEKRSCSADQRVPAERSPTHSISMIPSTLLV